MAVVLYARSQQKKHHPHAARTTAVVQGQLGQAFNMEPAGVVQCLKEQFQLYTQAVKAGGQPRTQVVNAECMSVDEPSKPAWFPDETDAWVRFLSLCLRLLLSEAAFFSLFPLIPFLFFFAPRLQGEEAPMEENVVPDSAMDKDDTANERSTAQSSKRKKQGGKKSRNQISSRKQA